MNDVVEEVCVLCQYPETTVHVGRRGSLAKRDEVRALVDVHSWLLGRDDGTTTGPDPATHHVDEVVCAGHPAKVRRGYETMKVSHY